MFKKGYYGNEGLGLAWECVRNVLKVNLLRDFGGKKGDFFAKKNFKTEKCHRNARFVSLDTVFLMFF